MVMILPRRKIIMAMIAGSLIAATVLRRVPRPHEENHLALRRRRYEFEDVTTISDVPPYGAFRRPVVVLSNPLKELLEKEFDDGSGPGTTGKPKVAESKKDSKAIYFSRGLWDSDLPRPNCPDGDDEHIYQVRRIYPCRFNYESYR